jgi:DNA-binding transcriptional LysR family regulator
MTSGPRDIPARRGGSNYAMNRHLRIVPKLRARETASLTHGADGALDPPEGIVLRTPAWRDTAVRSDIPRSSALASHSPDHQSDVSGGRFEPGPRHGYSFPMPRLHKPTRLDLRHIRSFRAVAEHGGFRAAAEALGVSQPTLSTHIAELEAELRVSLLSRTTRRVRLTRMGERFLARARRAMDDLQTAAIELQNEAALERGRVVLACTPSLVSHAVPPALRAFRQKYPAIAVEVLDEASGTVERRVVEGEADIAVGPRPERVASLAYHQLTRDRFVALFPVDAIDARTQAINLADLAGQQFISMMPGTSMRITIERAFAAAGLSYEPAFEVRNHSSVLGLAEAGLGIAILPESVVVNTTNRRTQTVAVRNPEIVRDIGILQRRGEVLSPAAAELAKLLKQAFARLKHR